MVVRVYVCVCGGGKRMHVCFSLLPLRLCVFCLFFFFSLLGSRCLSNFYIKTNDCLVS